MEILKDFHELFRRPVNSYIDKVLMNLRSLLVSVTETDRQRQVDRQTDKQAGRQANRQSGKATVLAVSLRNGYSVFGFGVRKLSLG